MSDPRRLLDDPALPPALREDLAQAAEAGSHYDVAAGLASLQVAIAAGTAAAASSSSGAYATQASVAKAGASGTATAGTSVAAKISMSVLGVVTLVTTSVALWPSAGSEEGSRRVGTPRAPSVQPAPQPEPTPLAAPVPTTEHVDTTAQQRTAEPMEPQPVLVEPAAEPPARPQGASANPRREIEQLGRIKALVDSSPQQAYQLAMAGHAEFPRGALRQEREAMAIFALENLGERTRAKARAERFLSRYPNSPMRERMHGIVTEH